MSNREKTAEQGGLQQFIRPVAIGVLVGAVVCIAVLVVFSFVLSTQNVPQSLIGPMASASIIIGAFAAGVACAKTSRQKGLLCGLACGIALSFVLLLASLGVSDSGFGVPALFKILFILLSSMLGGVIGVNSKKRRRAKR